MTDDRIYCAQCANLERGFCRKFGKSKYYRPILDVAIRCHVYKPNFEQADRRTGAIRWPHLSDELTRGSL